MTLHSELRYITNPPGARSTGYRDSDPAAALLNDLKGMPSKAKAELCETLFKAMPKEERTRALVKLSDAVNT